MRILVGVTGGIAAYKSLEFARLAVKAGHSVRVIQSPASLRFVGRSSFAAITGAPVLVSEFETDPARGGWPGEPLPEHQPISHLAVVERADVMVVAPATANTLARLAAGSGDDLICTAALAAGCPVVIAPAMNDRMWSNPATVENTTVLRRRGYIVMDPGEGMLASHGEAGQGRLPEPDAILDQVLSAAASERLDGELRGLRVLVTAGGTREPIDGVRYIGNRSSGRMGLALAEAAAAAGASVRLIAANVALPVGAGIGCVDVSTAAELQAALEREFDDCDVLLMAAAVADFRPASAAAGKLDKSKGVPTLELEAVPDLLTEVAARRRDSQLVIGFAAEHGLSTERAREKLVRKRLDAIVFNDISDPGIGFDSPDNEVTIISMQETVPVARAGKPEVASAIVRYVCDAVSALRQGR